MSARPIAVTMGEPAGIGGEISLKAWRHHRSDLPPFLLLDDPERLGALGEEIGEAIKIKIISEPGEAAEIFQHHLPVLPIRLSQPVISGHPNENNADTVIQSITTAVELAQSGDVSAIVTNPIHKLSLYNSGFKYPGHTEFVAELCGVSGEPVMMLASQKLRVVPVTRHVGLGAALNLLTEDLIVETVETLISALRIDFAIPAPRIAISALNPHAGEGNAMGDEETKIIRPAIERLNFSGITGPHSADTLFHERARQAYDAAVCMYHDQALIPIKTIDFDHAVNVTLGLPIVRTSPDHGTAFDIAGTGAANEASLVAAIKMASVIAANRASQHA
ncbi:MAG: 4-hydroxythreonine-4-phosphate dehydrogenase PdxA [Rhodospirillales bacterium]|nr:4-hydroxythreonine-4-phosphate dehydrogenase PdxA [Rhodospirillales bacterium]